MPNIALADDHKIVRTGIRRLLEHEGTYTIVGESADGLETIKMVETLKPDILILDMMIPGLSGLEVTRRLTKSSPDTKIIILSMHDDAGYVVESMRGGALAYVLKDSDFAELLEAIRAVLQGNRYLCRSLKNRNFEAYIARGSEDDYDLLQRLSEREREVLRMVAQGHTNGEVAKLLSISTRTVETHRTNLMRKLNLANHTELIRYAIKRGVVPLEG